MHSGRGVTETSSGRAGRRAEARAEGVVSGDDAVSGDDGAVRADGAVSDDPFARLGLPARPGVSDDDVRAAWRRIAAATHPDREDGGDPARFGAAAAAYVMLRAGFGRGEALADLGLSVATDGRGRHAHRRKRSADPQAAGAGRHRARRDAPAGRWLRRLTAPDWRWLRRLTAPDWRWLRPTGGSGQAGPPGRLVERERLRLAGWPSGSWRSGWSPRRRSVGSRLSRPQKRRPGRLAWRMAGAAAVGVAAVVISGWSPGVVGVLAGVLTWLLATARHALARRRSQ
jgi:curved DNA-binding protein CbpA